MHFYIRIIMRDNHIYVLSVSILIYQENKKMRKKHSILNRVRYNKQ